MAPPTLKLDADAIEPGDPITGRVQWSGQLKSFEVALRWETSGKGDKDGAVVATSTVSVDEAGEKEARFELMAPDQPISFSGTLISLAYYVRVKNPALEHDHTELEIVIAPGGKEVQLAGA